ncbi:peptidase C45 [Streptomyces yokosukanensis]|uniref:Peptidase C45 n=1 Tax=Streptomyces yokosukanensis TaxID=67386 RepID=A0A101NW59_9ACTN|nr:C45 family peptidase [Streptomyces yokosukanensis]KUN00452.1 peptidase C45 [Streptomyces yokosukanensis]
MPTESLPRIRAEGAPFDLGRAHGRERAPALRAFLHDALCRLNHILPRPVTAAELSPTIAAYRTAIEDAVPDIAREIEGLAEGAGLSLAEAYLLQLRREIMGYRKVPTMGDCTTYARSGTAAGGRPVLAQTVDLNGDLDDQITVLDVAPTGSRRRVLLLSFGGLLGYLGLNSSGLAVGINLVLGGTWRPGVPPYLAVRHLLDRAGTVDEAVALLQTLPLASSRSLTLCDSSRAVWAEHLEGRWRFCDGPQTLHTNHFLHPDLAPHDEVNVFARRSSVKRLEACRMRLATLPADASAEDHFGVLSAPPLCVADNGDIRRERTVAAAVMFPSRGELHLRPGDPSRHPTQVFALR